MTNVTVSYIPVDSRMVILDTVFIMCFSIVAGLTSLVKSWVGEFLDGIGLRINTGLVAIAVFSKEIQGSGFTDVNRGTVNRAGCGGVTAVCCIVNCTGFISFLGNLQLSIEETLVRCCCDRRYYPVISIGLYTDSGGSTTEVNCEIF